MLIFNTLNNSPDYFCTKIGFTDKVFKNLKGFYLLAGGEILKVEFRGKEKWSSHNSQKTKVSNRVL
jgi:hypothetical protein